ncbi:uncharacterized protein LOC124648567 [Lolium rigidum]|uniref:uncharacterized protein LOC124648567 n=1 Tax=Lolium rigidum TaxID=89674 RepID=UPI001F5CF1A9|nr:uncharacterized protein LOC124648567 [Lolium rigidum]
MSSTAEEPTEDAAGEWGKNPASKVEKKSAPKKDKNSTRDGGGIGVNLMLGKEQHEIDPQAQNGRNDKKTLEPIEAEEPASEGSSAAIKNREQISLSNKAGSYLPSDVVQTQLLAIPEEEAASKKPQLKMKKEKERKTAKLVKIKKEQQLGGVDKTQFPVEPHMPGDGEQAHSLCVPEEEDASKNLQMKKKEKKRKRVELEEIKKDEQLGGADKTQFPVEPDMPSDAEKAHSLCVLEEEDASKNLQMKKKEKKRKRVELEEIKKEEPWRWHATFCTVLRENSLHKGFLILRGNVKRLYLFDIEGTKLDLKYLKEGETVYTGAVFEFPCHIVDVGQPILKDEDAYAAIEHESKRDVKRKRLKRKPQPVTSPQAALLRSSIGMFARVASSRKGVSPQANVTVHFPSPHLQRRRRPRKLKSKIWKDFSPMYEHGKVSQGRCKHCNEVFLASQNSGTNHIRRHLKTCVVRSNMHEMVAKMRASSLSPKCLALDDWHYSQEESRKHLANMIVQHGLPFSIVEYSGFVKFVKSLNPMFNMVSRTTVKEDCMESYKEQRSMLRETLKNCGARVSLTADMWTSNQRLGYLCVTCHFIDKTWKMREKNTQILYDGNAT